jgi:dCTP deaminase
MTLKSDRWIKAQCNPTDGRPPMIEPFFEEIKRVDGERKIPSFGLSSYGYDVRLGDTFYFYTADPDYVESFNDPFVRATTVNYRDKQDKKCSAHYLTLPDKDDEGASVVDIADPSTQHFTKIENVKSIDLPPGGFCLGVTMEKINMPRDASVVCMGKSTVARNGVIVIVTPLEAGWSGYVTLEIYNTLPFPVRLYSGMGITQMQFFHDETEQCDVSYADRGGKYMDQPCEPVPPRL